MLKDLKRITTEQLKAYLNSLEDEETKEKALQINEYEEKCKGEQKKVKEREIQKIEENVCKKYKRRNQTKDKILSLLNEHDKLPEQREKMEVTKYMIYRVDISSAENIIEKEIKRLEKRYNEIEEIVMEEIDIFPELDSVQEIDFGEKEIGAENLEKIKTEFPEEYPEDTRRKLIQKELGIINKMKIFNETPVPHELLEKIDKYIQSRMPKFNRIRQRNLKIIDTMQQDYLKLAEPREIEEMIKNAEYNLESVSDILTKFEYTKVKNKLARESKKLERSTRELQNIIKTKEKKTGIINYNVKEARYARMEALRSIIQNATQMLKTYQISNEEEQLEKLEISYKREKQFASVIENLDYAGTDAGMEINLLEEQIQNLKQKIEISKKVVAEQEEKSANAKKELLTLWKIEIEETISNKNERLELPEKTQESTRNTEEKRSWIKTIFALKKVNTGKHAVTD